MESPVPSHKYMTLFCSKPSRVVIRRHLPDCPTKIPCQLATHACPRLSQTMELIEDGNSSSSSFTRLKRIAPRILTPSTRPSGVQMKTRPEASAAKVSSQ